MPFQLFHFNDKPLGIQVDATPARYTFYAAADGAASGTQLFYYQPQGQISSLVSFINQIGAYGVIQIADSSKYTYFGTDGTRGGSRKLFEYQGQSNVIETSSLLNVVNGRDIIAVNDGGLYTLFGTDGTPGGSAKLLTYDARGHFSSSLSVVDVLNGHDIIRVVDGQTYTFYCTDGTRAGTEKLFSYTATGPFSLATLIEHDDHDTVVINDNGRLSYFNIDCGSPGDGHGAQKLFQYQAGSPSVATANIDLGGLDLYGIADNGRYTYFASDGTRAGTQKQFSYQPVSPTAAATVFDTIGTHAVLQVRDAGMLTFYGFDAATGRTEKLFAYGSGSAETSVLAKFPSLGLPAEDLILICDGGLFSIFATSGSQGPLVGSTRKVLTYDGHGGNDSLSLINSIGLTAYVRVDDDDIHTVYAIAGVPGGGATKLFSVTGGVLTYLDDLNGVGDMFLASNNGRYTVYSTVGGKVFSYDAGGGANDVLIMNSAPLHGLDLFMVNDDGHFVLYATDGHAASTQIIYNYYGHGGNDTAELVRVNSLRYVIAVNDDDSHFMFLGTDGTTIPSDPGNHQHGTEVFLDYDAGGGVNSAWHLAAQDNIDTFVINDDNHFHLFASNSYASGTYDILDWNPVNAGGSIETVARADGHVLLAFHDGDTTTWYDLQPYTISALSGTPDTAHWW